MFTLNVNDMARSLRIEYHGAFYHITDRGVGRQDVFFKDYDRKVLLESREAFMKSEELNSMVIA